MTKNKLIVGLLFKAVLVIGFAITIATVNARACESDNKEVKGCAIDMTFGDETYTPPLSEDENQTIIIGATSADIKNCIANGGKTVSCLRKFLV
jgi:hypothetical protein